MPLARARTGRLDSSCSSRRQAWLRVFACVLASSSIALVGPAAEAQSAPSASDGGTSPDGGVPAVELEGPPVEIVEARRRGLSRAPAAQTSVIDVAQFGGEVRSVAELLATSPGVSLHSLGGPSQAATVSLRGASADQSTVLLDGIPLAGPGGGAVDLSTLPAALIDQIVVSRGVLGAQLGSGALGGVVELLPRSLAREGIRGGAQASFGSFGTAQLAADLSGAALESSGWLAAVQLDRTSGDYVYERKLTGELSDAPYYAETRANDDARRAAGLLRWTTRLSSSIEAGALAQLSGGQRGLPGPAGGPTPHARAEDASWLFGGRVQGLAGSTVWTLRAWGRGSWLRLQGLLPLAGDCSEDQPGCSPHVNRSIAGRVEAELRTPLGEAQWLSAVLAGGGEGASGDGVGLHQRAAGSVALASDVQLLQGALTLHPAMRLERVGAETGLSPGLAAVARPFGEASALAPIELRAGAGLSFRPPTFAELYLDQGSLTPNSELRPERAWSADLALAWRAEKITLSAGGFWTRYTDLILYEQYPPARIKPQNIGAARIAGLEAQAMLALPYALFAEASYTFLSGVNLVESATRGGQPLAYRPAHRLFVRGSHRGDRLEGYLEVDAASAMQRNDFGTAPLAGRILVNAGAGVRAVGPLWLDVELKNLLDDRRYQDLFQYPMPGFSLAVVARARL